MHARNERDANAIAILWVDLILFCFVAQHSWVEVNKVRIARVNSSARVKHFVQFRVFCRVEHVDLYSVWYFIGSIVTSFDTTQLTAHISSHKMSYII